MIYKVKKTTNGFTLTEKDGTVHTFPSETQVCKFLAGRVIDDMKLGDEKLVTDCEQMLIRRYDGKRVGQDRNLHIR